MPHRLADQGIGAEHGLEAGYLEDESLYPLEFDFELEHQCLSLDYLFQYSLQFAPEKDLQSFGPDRA